MPKFKVGDVVHRTILPSEDMFTAQANSTIIAVRVDSDGDQWLGFDGEENPVCCYWLADCFELVTPAEETSNNPKQNPKIIPNFQLRWVIIEKEKESIQNWNSNKPIKYFEQSKPVLQYSQDGVEWLDVPTVIIKED